MLRFNELRITPDNKYLIIDVEVENLNYYDNITIGNIVIDTHETFIQNSPSSNPVYTYTESQEDAKRVRLVINAKEINASLSNTMFFVYAIAKGIPSPDTPCGMDVNKIIGTVVNLYPIYQTSIKYMKELINTCDIPKNLIDIILRIKSVELCIKTGNYIEAIKQWKKFFANNTNIASINNCGCYGTSN